MIHRRTIELEIMGPILTRSNTVGAFGIDAPFARTPDNRFYIPGTLVIGRLAEAFRQLHQACQDLGDHSFGEALSQYFGQGKGTVPGDEVTGRANRRRLFVSDLRTEHSSSVRGTRTRIAVDGTTGTVAQGMMQVIEAPFLPGEVILFKGELRFLGTEQEAKDVLSKVEKALRWITQWGAFRSLGYGEAKSARLSTEVATHARPTCPIETPRKVRLIWTFHDPFCVGERKTEANTFVSADVVPGGVLKGALANQLIKGSVGTNHAFLSEVSDKLPEDLRPLAKAFDKLRFTHAFPAPREKYIRPRRVQHSWASSSQDLMDLAFLEDPSKAVLGRRLIKRPARRAQLRASLWQGNSPPACRSGLRRVGIA